MGREPFSYRPWVTGKLYDDLSRRSILHADAQVIDAGAVKYLVISWRRAGRVQVALDAYVIEADGITPVWDASAPARHALRLLSWGAPGVPWDALHARVCEQVAVAADAGEASGTWSRVTLLCHYVPRADVAGEIERNVYGQVISHNPA